MADDSPYAPPLTEPTAPMESSQAVLAMVLAGLSFITCGPLMSIPAIILARTEIKAIRDGRRSEQNLGLAQGAFWVATINIAIILLIPFIAILAAVLVPTVIGQVERARNQRALSDTTELARAIGRVHEDTGSTAPECLTLSNLLAAKAPAACGAIKACTQQATPAACWGGPYVATLPNDSWGNPYRLGKDPRTGAVGIISNGVDGAPDTEDDVFAPLASAR